MAEVRDALQQRTDVDDLSPRYLKRAIQEVTESYPFEELRTTGPTVALTTGQPEYPDTFFLNSGEEYTQLPVLTVYVDFPTNQVKTVLQYKTPPAMEPMTSAVTVGIPSRWTRFGGKFLLGPTPNQNYSMFARYQMRHPFPVQESDLPNAPVYLPDSWGEIVVYAAAERIALVKRWTDQIKVLHDILYGDPEYSVSEGKRGRPGLIAARLFQQERDQAYSSRQLMPRVARYTYR